MAQSRLYQCNQINRHHTVPTARQQWQPIHRRRGRCWPELQPSRWRQTRHHRQYGLVILHNFVLLGLARLAIAACYKGPAGSSSVQFGS